MKDNVIFYDQRIVDVKNDIVCINEAMKKFDTMSKEEKDSTICKIVDSFKPLIYSEMKRYFTIIDPDIYQDAVVEIIEKTYRFDPELGVDYVGYLKKFLKLFFLRKGCKYYDEKKHEVKVEDETISATYGECDHYDFETVSLLNCLTEKERIIIIEHIIKRRSLKIVAKELNISHSTAKRIKKPALYTLKSYL